MLAVNPFLQMVKKFLIIPVVIVALVALYCVHALLQKSRPFAR